MKTTTQPSAHGLHPCGLHPMSVGHPGGGGLLGGRCHCSVRAVHNLNDVLLIFGGGRGFLPVLCDVFDGPLCNLFGVLRTMGEGCRVEGAWVVSRWAICICECPLNA